jgi:Zn-dependent metalloprotease
MMLRKTMIAAAIALCAQSGFAAAMPAQANASLMAELAHERAGKGLDSDHGFVISRQHPGQQDKVITRLNHTYKGIRIFESEAVVVSDNRGHIISQTMADRRGGIAKSAIANKKASIGSQAAIDAAIRSVGGAGNHVSAPSAEIIYYPVMKTQRVPAAANKADDALNAMDVEDVVDSYRLAYQVETRMIRGGRPVYHSTIVDAASGAVLDQWSMVHDATAAIGVGKSQYNGTVPVATSYTGTQYQMIDLTRGTGGTYGGMAITNANHGTTAGAVYVDPDNTWGDGKQYIAGGSTTNDNGQTAAVNALWGLMNTYDTMKNVLGWKSLDGKNTATYIAVHVNTGYDNAYYTDTCKCMFIGDGGTYFNNLGSNDVIGHEMGHGVTAATSNLTYRGESGGLNESSSDINGEAVEAYARNGGTGSIVPEKNDWLVGAEIAKDGVPLRFFKKPSKDGASADAWSRKLRNLDVHYSSGPNNRMFYFLSEGSTSSSTPETYSQYLKSPMTGIGIDKAYRIWFHANTTKFTSSTNYATARTLMQASAEELYGVGSAESKAVQRAYAAINVGSDI